MHLFIAVLADWRRRGCLWLLGNVGVACSCMLAMGARLHVGVDSCVLLGYLCMRVMSVTGAAAYSVPQWQHLCAAGQQKLSASSMVAWSLLLLQACEFGFPVVSGWWRREVAGVSVLQAVMLSDCCGCLSTGTAAMGSSNQLVFVVILSEEGGCCGAVSMERQLVNREVNRQRVVRGSDELQAIYGTAATLC